MRDPYLLGENGVTHLLLGFIIALAVGLTGIGGGSFTVPGLLLAITSSVTFVPRVQNPTFALKNARWLPWLAFPIGVESGFSSAGAGALGTVLLLNYSEMAPAQVVGTDIAFGLVLAIIGSAVHWTFGSVSTQALLQLLAGGVPGVIIGCLLP